MGQSTPCPYLLQADHTLFELSQSVQRQKVGEKVEKILKDSVSLPLSVSNRVLFANKIPL